MAKRPVTLKEMRAIQLDILDVVHAFCMDHGLRYSLGEGTLLTSGYGEKRAYAGIVF